MSKDKRKIRKEARKARVAQRQAAKSARQEKRQENRAGRQAQRQEARGTRQAVKQTARLARVAKRKKLNESLENLGPVAEAQKSAAAIREQKTAEKIKAYIKNQGEDIPEDASPEEIAGVAQELRDEEIQDTQEALNEDLQEGDEPYTSEEAEEYLYDMYDAEAFDGDDVNNYDPATAAAVAAASKKGLQLLAEKRAKQGKKTLGMTPEELNKTLNPNYAPEKDPTTDAGRIYAAGKGAYVSQTASQNSDWIIFIVLILLGVGIYFGIKASK